MENGILSNGAIGEKRFCTLFRERVPIEYMRHYFYKPRLEDDRELVFRSNSSSSWYIERSGNIKNATRFGTNPWSENLPGIHQISKADFNVLCARTEYLDLLSEVILSREKKTVNLRTASIVKNWFLRFLEIHCGRGGNGYGINLFLHRVDSEGLLVITHGRKRAYLPAGYAAETILALGNRFLKPAEARKIAQKYKTMENLEAKTIVGRILEPGGLQR